MVAVFKAVNYMEEKRIIRNENNIVSWMSGLNQHPAKVSFGVIRAVGSNPTLTAKIRISEFESPVFRQIRCQRDLEVREVL